MRVLVATITALLAGVCVAETSPDGIWTLLSDEEAAAWRKARGGESVGVDAYRYRVARINSAAFAAVTASVPLERLDLDPAARPRGVEFSVPMPDGSYARFRVLESPVMEPGLAARYPAIRTYVGQGVDDPSATLRMDKTPAGFHAQVLSHDGTVYVEPYFDESSYITFWKSDHPAGSRFTCHVDDSLRSSMDPVSSAAVRSGSQLRTYRLAMACSGEYAQYHGGTVESALSAIVTTVNRVTGIYENELAIRLVLVANNDDIVFTNPNTDPYSNGDAFALLSQNQSTLDSIIGNPNYDIGHVVTTGSGGLAVLGVVCATGLKAKGTTGLSSPEGDVFDVDYVSHEIGHQFDADHTFNGVAGSCSGNRVGTSAYEPGSGSTILAYAGICETDNLQANSDPYFHSRSLEQMLTFVVGGGGCAGLSATGNTEPVADAGPDYTIPRGTPFTLTGTGSDGDDDMLSFCWEQRDLGSAAALSAPDDGSIPLFRSRSPVGSPSRTFPDWSTLLTDAVDHAEKLPQASRAMDFRLSVRDNNAAGGGLATDDMVITVDATQGPFGVTYPNGGESLGGAVVVTWDVAGTTAPPVSVSHVDILCSLDGGETFDLVLVEDTPNDGSELVSLPNAASVTARVMVRATENIFFDVSSSDFETVLVILEDVYVDFGYTGTEAGTESQPFSTVEEAAAVVSHGGTIWIAPGSAAEIVTLDQFVTLRVNGAGSVRIGAAPTV